MLQATAIQCFSIANFRKNTQSMESWLESDSQMAAHDTFGTTGP